MGYYTKYELSTFYSKDKKSYTPIEELRAENICARSAFSEDGDFKEELKWYDHENDLKEFSSRPKYKDVLFALSGIGENEGDIWIKYFKNGKMQVCEAEIVYPSFDESKLQ